MGTRSITAFFDEMEQEIVVMYRHMDGYIEYYGKRLCEYLLDRTANGMSCLTAQAIMHFKSDVKNYDYNNRVFNSETGHMESVLQEGNHSGGIYLYPAGTRNCGERYLYLVKKSKEGIILEAYMAGSREWTSSDGKYHFPAVPDELIHKGLVSDNWFEQALKAEQVILERKVTQELKQ